VTVLEMNALMAIDTTATAARIRTGRSPTQGTASTANASRRSSRWSRIASANRNDPMNRKISGSANGRNTSLTGATPHTTQAVAPSSAVTASGRASVNQSTMTAATITANRCASGVRSMRASVPAGPRGGPDDSIPDREEDGR